MAARGCMSSHHHRGVCLVSHVPSSLLARVVVCLCVCMLRVIVACERGDGCVIGVYGTGDV